MQWLTTYEPSTEHDLAAGLRDNFDPRARWRSAITRARALHRLGSLGGSSSTSKSSGGWANSDDDDDDDDEPTGHTNGVVEEQPEEGRTEGVTLNSAYQDPGSNENIKVTGPEEDGGNAKEGQEKEIPSSRVPPPTEAHALKREDDADAHAPLHQEIPDAVHEHQEQLHDEPESILEEEEEEPELNIPGSFDLSAPPPARPGHSHGQGDTDDGSWVSLMRKMRLR